MIHRIIFLLSVVMAARASSAFITLRSNGLKQHHSSYTLRSAPHCFYRPSLVATPTATTARRIGNDKHNPFTKTFTSSITTTTTMKASNDDTTTTTPTTKSIVNDDELIQMQQKLSTSLSSSSTNTTMKQQEEFLAHQKKVFDEMSSYFNSSEACPPEVKPLLQFIVAKFLSEMQNQKNNMGKKEEEEEGVVYNILDVGCGTGVLFPFYLDNAKKKGMDVMITGNDLSDQMIGCARERAGLLLLSEEEEEEEEEEGKFDFATGDFVSMILDDEKKNGEDEYVGKYDGVMVNACFGNFLDTDAVMTALAKCVKKGGIVCIAHPLGREFVQKLHNEDPNTVPHNLPTQDEFSKLTKVQELKVVDFVSSIESQEGGAGEKKQISIYYASSVRE